MTLFILSFVAGLLTVLAPCILPLLPVIVGGSLDGEGGGQSKRRVFTVLLSLAISLIAFTFLLKVSTALIMIPESFWKYLSGGIIIGFGLVSLFPALWEKVSFAGVLNQKSNALLGKGFQKKSAWGDVIIGASLGPVFATCSPTYFLVLATVLPVSLALGFTYILVYTIGLCIALLAIVIVGQKLMNKLGVAADPHGKFKRILGLIFLIVGLGIMTGYDKKLERGILEAGLFDITKIEQALLQKHAAPKEEGAKEASAYPTEEEILQLQASEENQVVETVVPAIEEKPVVVEAPKPTPVVTPVTPKPTTGKTYLSATLKEKIYKKAPEIVNPQGFINTNELPILISQYKGKKVVLIDFWTYSCINCQRTIPYLTQWHGKYKDQGLVIIGVHTPEFAFERVESNVLNAVKNFKIEYPVVLDNEYATWGAFGNQFWPRKYLIDIDGFIVYDHIGEGAYAETEKKIQEALMERSAKLNANVSVTTTIATPSEAVVRGKVRSPEIYFGAGRNSKYLGNGTAGVTGEQVFTLPTTRNIDKLYFGGTWNVTDEHTESVSAGATFNFKYGASRVYSVLSASKAVKLKVTLDGAPLGARAGADVTVEGGQSYITVSSERLYDIVNDRGGYGEHELQFTATDAGLNAFTFTFG